MFRAPDRIDRSIRSVESIVREFSCRLRGKSGTAGGIRGTDVFFIAFQLAWLVRGNWKTLFGNVATIGNGSENRILLRRVKRITPTL